MISSPSLLFTPAICRISQKSIEDAMEFTTFRNDRKEIDLRLLLPLTLVYQSVVVSHQ